MLGRRKSRSSPEAIDITERIRRRTPAGGSSSGSSSASSVGVVPANSGNSFSRPRPARSKPPRRGAKTAAVLSFKDTPVYRIQAGACVPRETLYLALAVLADRLESQGPMVDSRQEMWRRIGDLIGEVLDDLQVRLPQPKQSELIERLLDELVGFGPLGVLLADESVSDIMVNGPDAVYVKRRGRVQATDVAFRGPAHLAVVQERIAAAAGRRFGQRQSLLGLRVSDRVRADIIVPPLAPDGPQLTLRKGVRLPIALERMVKQGSLSAEMAEVLRVAVRCRLNIVIVGAPGSGKTALLDAMSELIHPRERIVTIEETAELALLQPQVVRLVGRLPSGAVAEGQSRLVRTGLHLRPDRVVVGELQGNEANDLIMAMNDERNGLLATLSAGGTRAALSRLEALAFADGPSAPMPGARTRVAEAIDLIVQLERCDDGLRRVSEISEVVGLQGDTIEIRELFALEPSSRGHNGHATGRFKATGLSPYFMDRIRDRGLRRRLRHALGPTTRQAGRTGS